MRSLNITVSWNKRNEFVLNRNVFYDRKRAQRSGRQDFSGWADLRGRKQSESGWRGGPGRVGAASRPQVRQKGLQGPPPGQSHRVQSITAPTPSGRRPAGVQTCHSSAVAPKRVLHRDRRGNHPKPQVTPLRSYVFPREFSSHTDIEGHSFPANPAAGGWVAGGGRGRDVGGRWRTWPRKWPLSGHR